MVPNVMEMASNRYDMRWTIATIDLVILASVMLFLLVAFFAGLRDLENVWATQEEYSYGYLIPVVTMYLLWQRRELIATTQFTGSWWGVALVAIGVALLAIGQIGTLGTVVQYAFLCALLGLVVAYTGWRGFAVMAMPFAILAFMVPLPNYLLREVSQALQLWSSQLGVMMIRAFGISVFLEGNVIDLGGLRLQVVEACSGLRYLLPLMAIGFIAACLFRAPLWKRLVVFLSTIPITLLMNSARIGMIGILSEYFGKSMAEGFLHDFEGWVVFMICTALLIGEIALLARMGPVKASLADVFVLPTIARSIDARSERRHLPAPFLAAGAMVTVAAIVSQTIAIPAATLPDRRMLSEFPMELGSWRGTPGQIESQYLDMLKLDDYLLADYANDLVNPVNLYVSYYASQANGNSAHSPRACIPGDGWEIADFRQRTLAGVAVGGESLKVNRVVIQRGDNRQLVYYWFQQRGHVITNEYMVKLQIFRDAVTRRRTDGAMVRLVARLRPGETVESGDALLENFAAQVVPKLTQYVPD
jgi:exosortase D (VPLPA-CTERM-specific)